MLNKRQLGYKHESTLLNKRQLGYKHESTLLNKRQLGYKHESTLLIHVYNPVVSYAPNNVIGQGTLGRRQLNI